LQAVNPFLIVIGLILFIPLANKFNIFKMLVYGSMVSAVSLFPLALSCSCSRLTSPRRITSWRSPSWCC
jgi:hypothetical protein